MSCSETTKWLIQLYYKLTAPNRDPGLRKIDTANTPTTISCTRSPLVPPFARATSRLPPAPKGVPKEKEKRINIHASQESLLHASAAYQGWPWYDEKLQCNSHERVMKRPDQLLLRSVSGVLYMPPRAERSRIATKCSE